MANLTRLKKTSRVLVLIMWATLTVCGGAMVYFMSEFMNHITQADAPPSQEAIQHVGLLILAVTFLAGLPAVGFGAYVMYVGWRIRLTGQWPPAGMGFQADSPVMLGKRAGWIGLVVMALGAGLIVVGLGLPLIGWRVEGMLHGKL